MSSLYCWMHHDRQGCLSKEIIPHLEFNSCWWNSSKFHRRLFAILPHWCPAPAEWFLPPSTPGVQVSSLRQWCSKVSEQVIALHWINGRGSTQLLQPLNLRGKLRLHSATALPPVTASPTWHPSDLLYSNGSAGSGSGWYRASSRLKTRYLGVWRLQILKACLLEAPKNSWRILEGTWISKLPEAHYPFLRAKAAKHFQ